MTNKPTVRLANTHDIGRLLALMGEFYGESGYRLNSDRAEHAFEELLSDPRLGAVWLLEVDSDIAGYVVLTLGYSMEYGGRDAFVDDLYVRPRYRGMGLGTLALATVRARCKAEGVRALHLEVGRDNTVAQRLYAGAGFKDNNRQLPTLRLADPTHGA